MSSRPPLAGRPPFATDEPDHVYDSPPRPRLRVPKPDNPNDRTSAYDVYDDYLDGDARQSTAMGGIGEGFMNGNYSDSEDEDDNPKRRPSQRQQQQPPQQQPQQRSPAATPTAPLNVAQPRPGYAIPPTSPLRINPPKPVAVPDGRTLAAPNGPGGPPSARGPPPNLFIQTARGVTPPQSPGSVPASPHPLQAPMTPITPVFARPAKPSTPRPDEKVKFDVAVMRGNSEDALLPRRGEKGDDFWRRFSVVAHDEKKPSVWLTKTQSGTNRLSRWVWCVGIILLLAIVGASCLAWWLTRHNNSHRDPTSFGGGASEVDSATAYISSSLAGAVAGGETSSEQVVHPTFTLPASAAKRDLDDLAAPTPAPEIFNHGRSWHARRYNKGQL